MEGSHHTPAQSPGSAASPPVPHFLFWIPLVAAAAIWLPVLNHLRLEWMVNEQYRYGLLVPVLAAYLGYLRWADRPEPQPPHSLRWPVLLGALLLAAQLPLFLVEAANPDWRLLSWGWTSAAVALTGLGVFACGGWPWLRHFLVPLTFIFVAVPWPMAWEMRLVQGLMRSNAAAAVEILHWFAVPAVQAGNVIHIGAAAVGIDEACSGVRSLQTSLMAGWLFGERYRLAAAWRVGLLASCAAVALFWNVLRTLVLVGIAHVQGTEAMSGWHDPIGIVVLGLALASWIFLAKAACRIAQPAPAEEWIVRGVAPHCPESPLAPPAKATSLPASWSWLVIGWMLLCCLAVEIWYWPTRTSRERPFDWTVRWPATFSPRERPIPAATRGILKYTRGTHRTWEDASGHRWSAFHLEWAPGRTAYALAQGHRPEICLPATGRELREDRGIRLFQGAGVALHFRHYVFSDGGHPLHVFFSLATRRGEEHRGAPIFQALTRAERFRAVRERRRNEGQQQLEVGIWGILEPQEAERIFTDALQELLVPVAPA